MTVDIEQSMTEDLVRLQRRVELYLFDLILLGCVSDPIIYAARMRQVRSGYARLWSTVVGREARRDVHRPPTGSVLGRVLNRSNETASSSTATGRRSNNAVSTTRANEVVRVSEEAKNSV